MTTGAAMGASEITATITVADGETFTKAVSFNVIDQVVFATAISNLTVDGTAQSADLSIQLNKGSFELGVEFDPVDTTEDSYTVAVTGSSVKYDPDTKIVTLLSTGDATITVTAQNASGSDITKSLAVKVTNYAESAADVTISGGSVEINGTSTVSLNFGDKSYHSIAWTIDDSTYATIPDSSTGTSVVATGVSVGSATITASITPYEGATPFDVIHTVDVVASVPVVGHYCFSDYTTSATLTAGKTVIGIVYAVDEAEVGYASVVSINAPYKGVPWCHPDANYFDKAMVSETEITSGGGTGFEYMTYLEGYCSDNSVDMAVYYPAFDFITNLNGDSFSYSGQTDYNKIWVMPSEDELEALYMWLGETYSTDTKINAAFTTGGRSTTIDYISTFSTTTRSLTTTDIVASGSTTYTYSYGGLSLAVTTFATKVRTVNMAGTSSAYTGIATNGQHKTQTAVHLVPIMHFKY